MARGEKTCPICQNSVGSAVKQCNECGHDFKAARLSTLGRNRSAIRPILPATSRAHHGILVEIDREDAGLPPTPKRIASSTNVSGKPKFFYSDPLSLHSRGAPSHRDAKVSNADPGPYTSSAPELHNRQLWQRPNVGNFNQSGIYGYSNTKFSDHLAPVGHRQHRLMPSYTPPESLRASSMHQLAKVEGGDEQTQMRTFHSVESVAMISEESSPNQKEGQMIRSQSQRSTTVAHGKPPSVVRTQFHWSTSDTNRDPSDNSPSDTNLRAEISQRYVTSQAHPNSNVRRNFSHNQRNSQYRQPRLDSKQHRSSPLLSPPKHMHRTKSQPHTQLHQSFKHHSPGVAQSHPRLALKTASNTNLTMIQSTQHSSRRVEIDRYQSPLKQPRMEQDGCMAERSMQQAPFESPSLARHVNSITNASGTRSLDVEHFTVTKSYEQTLNPKTKSYEPHEANIDEGDIEQDYDQLPDVDRNNQPQQERRADVHWTTRQRCHSESTAVDIETGMTEMREDTDEPNITYYSKSADTSMNMGEQPHIEDQMYITTENTDGISNAFRTSMRTGTSNGTNRGNDTGMGISRSLSSDQRLNADGGCAQSMHTLRNIRPDRADSDKYSKGELNYPMYAQLVQETVTEHVDASADTRNVPNMNSYGNGNSIHTNAHRNRFAPENGSPTDHRAHSPTRYLSHAELRGGPTHVPLGHETEIMGTPRQMTSFSHQSPATVQTKLRHGVSTPTLVLRRHPLSDSYRSRTNIQSDVWKGATSNKRQHTPPTPTLQAAAVNTFGKNDGTSIQPPREHLRGKSHAQRKERRTPDVTLNEAPMHTSDAERRDRSLTDMARIISSTNVQAGSQKSDRVPHGVDSIISHTGESVSGASNFIRSHIDSAVRLLTRLTIGEMKNSSNSETEQLAIPQHLSESMRDGSNDELGALPSHNFSSTTTGSGIHDRVKKNSARIPSGLIGSDRVKNQVLELDVDEEVYSLLCKQDVCKQDVTHTHARSSPSLHRRRHSVYDIPVSLLDTHALVPNFSHLQPSDMPSHTQHQSTPNIYPLNCDSGGRETADSPSTHTTTRDMTRDRKSSGHTPKTVENTPLRRVEKRNNTAHSTAEASRTFVRIKRTDTGHVMRTQCAHPACTSHGWSIANMLNLGCHHGQYCESHENEIQLARSCPVTADGFKAATSRGLKHLHLAYDLGYRSCTVLGIPLLQRVDYNVYAVFNGVSEVSPFGFVHMTVKKREHVVQRSADDDWETQMHQPKFVHAKSSQEGSGRGSLRSSGSMSDLYRNVDERADSRQGISRPEKSISSLNLRGLARMHVTDDDGVRDKVFDWESNKPGREIGAGYPRWASTEGLSMGADLAQARSNSQLPQRPLPNTVFGFRSPSPGLDTRDGRDGSLSVQGPLAQAEFEITCDCTKPVKSRPRHMPLASRADTNRTAGWGNDAHERADGHTQSSTRVQPDTPANKYAATNDLLRTAAHPYASVREGENGGEHRYNASPSTTDPDAQGRECTLGEASDRYCVHGTCFLWHLHSLEVEDKHVPLEQKALPPYEDMEMALLLLGNGASGGGI